MEFKTYTDFANKNTTCYVATCEGDQPRVRAINMWFADETGFYFQTQSVKALPKQLKKNKRIEVCYWAPGAEMMRVSGEVEFVNDLKLRAKCLEQRVFLKQLGIVKPEDPMLVVFRIAKGEVYFWTMKDSMKEDKIPRCKFGA